MFEQAKKKENFKGEKNEKQLFGENLLYRVFHQLLHPFNLVDQRQHKECDTDLD